MDEECATPSRTVTARKARYEGSIWEIRIGDRVRVDTGFFYVPGGPRTGYFRHYFRAWKGPAWAKEEA